MIRQLPICEAVRAVGVARPKFNTSSQQFDPPSLDVLGTGFWLEHVGSQIFVTCAHVVMDLLGPGMMVGPRQIKPIELVGMLVVGGNNRPYAKASISVVDVVHDLAILDVQGDGIKNPLSTTEKSISVGEKVAYSGFPLGNQLLNEKHSPSYAEGVVGSEIIDKGGPKFIQISGPVVGGYSGSPVVSLEEPSKVIGVVSNGPSETQSIFRAIHWKHINILSLLMAS